MLELKIENEKYSLPSEWSEVTLRNYIDIISISEDKKLSQLDGFVKTLSLLANNKYLISAIESLPIEEFEQIRDSFNWLQVEPKAPKKKQDFFLINGEKWTIKDNFNKLTVGESISVEMMLKDKSLDLTPMEIAFGILFRKAKADGSPESLNPDDISKIINEHSKHIKIEDVYNVVNFFLLGGKKSSSRSTKGFSISITPKTKTKILKTSK